MDENIKSAIKESISHDCIAHTSITIGDMYDDMLDALAGVDFEEYAILDGGKWDVWGTDDNGETWRIVIDIERYDSDED